MRSFLFFCFVNITFLGLHNQYAYSQDSTLVFNIDLQGSLATNKTPFWLQSNQFGTIPASGSFISGQWGLHKVYNHGNPRFFQWSAGAQMITNQSKSGSVFFTDLFLAAKAGPVELSVGQRRDFMGLADSTLSTGSLAMSGNSRPYPKIQLSTPDFVNFIPGNDLISFKLSYADGLLGSARIGYGNVSKVPDVYMHQKSLYLRLGGLHHKMSLHAGFNHQAMWGGEDIIFSGGLPAWEAYKYVIFGKPWAASRVGNHFGTIDLGAEWRGKNWDIFLYRQSIYEDGSLAQLSNIVDGLNGLRFKRTNIDKNDRSLTLNTVLLEFIYTKEQGGKTFDFDSGTFGNDNYFNHYVYSQGWSYRGRSLGTPLAVPQNISRNDIPYTSSLFTANNRIMAFHLGLNASFNRTIFLLKGTYSQNFGTYNYPFSSTRNQLSLLIHAERAVPVWKASLLSLSLAADAGKLYPNSSAITLGWRKIGFIR